MLDNNNGEGLWERTFRELTSAMIWRVRASKDGNIVFAGFARSTPESRREVWIGKLDRRGKTLWTQRYWNPKWSVRDDGTPFAFRPTADGGYLVAAVHGKWNGSNWILRLDAEGSRRQTR